MRAFVLSLSMLAASPALVRAADDPEPPAQAQLRPLLGKWRSVRLSSKGRIVENASNTYVFGRDGFDYSSGVLGYRGTLRVVSSRSPLVLAMTREKSTATLHFAARVENDRLYLAVFPGNEIPRQVDFTGNSYSVLVLKREN